MGTDATTASSSACSCRFHSISPSAPLLSCEVHGSFLFSPCPGLALVRSALVNAQTSGYKTRPRFSAPAHALIAFGTFFFYFPRHLLGHTTGRLPAAASAFVLAFLPFCLSPQVALFPPGLVLVLVQLLHAPSTLACIDGNLSFPHTIRRTVFFHQRSCCADCLEARERRGWTVALIHLTFILSACFLLICIIVFGGRHPALLFCSPAIRKS